MRKLGPSKVKHPALGHTAPQVCRQGCPEHTLHFSTYLYVPGLPILQLFPPNASPHRAKAVYFCLSTLAHHITRQQGAGVSAQNAWTCQAGAQQSTGCSKAFCSSLNGKLASSLSFKQKVTLLIKVTLKSISLTSLMMAHADIMCLLT